MVASYDSLFQTIEELVLCHSPSGMEQEIDRVLLQKFQDLNCETWQDPAGNIIAKIPGDPGQQSPALAITAHKDEIGMIVKGIAPNGKISVRKLGGSFPWVYGEGVVDLLGDETWLSGILSFGSRHVSHESRQSAQQDKAPLRWEDAWVETKCTLAELNAAGIRPGTRVVVGKHRKRPFRLGDYVASYTLDNKASLTILLELAKALKQLEQVPEQQETQQSEPVPEQAPEQQSQQQATHQSEQSSEQQAKQQAKQLSKQPSKRQLKSDVYLIASAKEEVGAIGALYFSQHHKVESLIALEICPLAPEYPIHDGVAPVLLSQDGYGIYDEDLNQALYRAARQAGVPLQLAVIDQFGSDASIAMKFGHIARGACLGFPTQNTHGYEITHLGAIDHCIQILTAYCLDPLPPLSQG